jgi:hypothetical protein
MIGAGVIATLVLAYVVALNSGKSSAPKLTGAISPPDPAAVSRPAPQPPEPAIPEGRATVAEVVGTLSETGAGECERRESETNTCLIGASAGYPFLVKLETATFPIADRAIIRRIVVSYPAGIPAAHQAAAMSLMFAQARVADPKDSAAFTKAITKPGKHRFDSEHFAGQSVLEVTDAGAYCKSSLLRRRSSAAQGARTVHNHEAQHGPARDGKDSGRRERLTEAAGSISAEG